MATACCQTVAYSIQNNYPLISKGCGITAIGNWAINLWSLAELNSTFFTVLIINWSDGLHFAQSGRIARNTGLSMCSLGTEDQFTGSSNRVFAVYKGLTVAVFTSTKEQINLTRQNLIDLINV
jgi:hypothetical protein